jgi:formate dehydrogenase
VLTLPRKVLPVKLVAPSQRTTDYTTYRANGGFSWLPVWSAVKTAECILKAMEDSGLRSLGGAGAPAGRKWRIVRDQPAPRVMASTLTVEPGTFKDRTYLERDPHRFLEGLLIAAQVVGVEACYIYLRDEYHGCRNLLEAEDHSCRPITLSFAAD